MADLINEAINAGRIPDTIKNLPCYDVNPGYLVPWIETTQGIINYYTTLRNEPIYQIWINQIRNKNSTDSKIWRQ